MPHDTLPLDTILSELRATSAAWLKVEARADYLSRDDVSEDGRHAPSVHDYVRAAQDVLGADAARWDGDVRDALRAMLDDELSTATALRRATLLRERRAVMSCGCCGASLPDEGGCVDCDDSADLRAAEVA